MRHLTLVRMEKIKFAIFKVIKGYNSKKTKDILPKFELCLLVVVVSIVKYKFHKTWMRQTTVSEFGN